MAALVVVLRIVSLLAVAGPITLKGAASKRRVAGRSRQRAPVVSNLVASGVFLVCLVAFSRSAGGPPSMLLASLGTAVAIGGAAIARRSRAALGAAWSLVPNADTGTGLVTSGPYSRVRHPIYLGLTVLALGQAVAFGSWPALAILVVGVVPSFVWRARAEEKLLGSTFGECYARYKRQTRMIIPFMRGRRTAR